MRYRQLSPTGDYQFGHSDAQFLVNTPEAVAQAAQTRFQLSAGEWYLDLLKGMPYDTKVLGENTQSVYDQAIQEYLLDTEGVTSITDYISIRDPVTRALSVTASIKTIYGDITVQQVF